MGLRWPKKSKNIFSQKKKKKIRRVVFPMEPREVLNSVNKYQDWEYAVDKMTVPVYTYCLGKIINRLSLQSPKHPSLVDKLTDHLNLRTSLE